MSSIEAIKVLEGSRVSVALRDGSRVDDCQLVSAPRGPLRKLWLFSGGADVFVPLGDVLEVWETAPPAGHPCRRPHAVVA